MTAQLKITARAERRWGWPVLKNLLRAAGGFLLGATMALLVSPLAAAHISAELDGAGPGDFGLITLGVPTESGKPATTKVEVRIPDDIQLRTVRPGQVAGWGIDIAKRTIPPIYKDDGTPVTEVVDSVTWTAQGLGIPPGQFGQFALYVGPLPDTATLALPTVQTFSDGTTEDWAQAANEGEDPEFPAPTVTIGAAASAADGASTLASVIPWVALGFSVIAVALGIFAIDRAAASRRSTNAATDE
ncbi:MAG: YcnI family protein [Actinomycetia bacterium]|nr:YcnI family protein [Actinomycetes bacterium]